MSYLERFYKSIETDSETVMYFLYEKGWRFVGRFKSGVMHKNGVFFVIKKYSKVESFPNFVYEPGDVSLDRINSIRDLDRLPIPVVFSFQGVDPGKCGWYLVQGGELLEKGEIPKGCVLIRRELRDNASDALDTLDKKEISEFREMISTIDLFAELPIYARNVFGYEGVVTQKITSEKCVFVTGDCHPDEVVYQCSSTTPIWVPENVYNRIEPVLQVLGIQLVEERNGFKQLLLPIKEGFYYKVVDQKQFQNNLTILILIEINSDFTNLRSKQQLRQIALSSEIEEILISLGNLIAGKLDFVDVVEDVKVYKKKRPLNVDKVLLHDLDHWECNGIALGDFQKEAILEVLLEGLNPTILINNTLSKESYGLLVKLLKAGADPLVLVDRSSTLLEVPSLQRFLSLVESGYDLRVFLNLQVEGNLVDYYYENVKKSIEERLESFLQEGYSQEHLRFLRKAFSQAGEARSVEATNIEKTDTSVQLLLKSFLIRGDSYLLRELLGESGDDQNFVEISFSLLSEESTREIRKHLFYDGALRVGGAEWSTITNFILENSKSLYCKVGEGLRIHITDNYTLGWDENSVTLFQLAQPIWKALFVNGAILCNRDMPILSLLGGA